MSENFTLRPYQEETVGFLVNKGRALCGDAPGTGKTVSCLVAAESLTSKPFLVLCPKIALGIWEDHVHSVLGRDCLVFSGRPSWRSNVSLDGANIIIAPYSMSAEIAARRDHWPLVIADEAHNYRNRKTNLFDTIKAFRSEYFFAASGTFVVRDTLDLWTQLHILDPKRFSSYWKWAAAWYNTMKDERGHWITIPKPKDPGAFRDMRRQYEIRHTKEAVLADLPPKVRRRVPIEMTKAQASFYNDLADDMMAEYGGRLILTPTVLAQITRLRQILITPALIGGPKSSAALEALTEGLRGEFDVGRASLVMTPFTDAFPYLQEAAQKAGARHIGIIQGGMAPEKLKAVLTAFRAAEGNKILLCSLLASTSWTATEAATEFFVGYDWSPMANWQAEDRIHRIGQTDSVEINYFVNKGTIDEHIMEILTEKKDWSEVGYDAAGMLRPRLQ